MVWKIREKIFEKGKNEEKNEIKSVIYNAFFLLKSAITNAKLSSIVYSVIVRNPSSLKASQNCGKIEKIQER